MQTSNVGYETGLSASMKGQLVMGSTTTGLLEQSIPIGSANGEEHTWRHIQTFPSANDEKKVTKINLGKEE